MPCALPLDPAVFQNTFSSCNVNGVIVSVFVSLNYFSLKKSYHKSYACANLSVFMILR